MTTSGATWTSLEILDHERTTVASIDIGHALDSPPGWNNGDREIQALAELLLGVILGDGDTFTFTCNKSSDHTPGTIKRRECTMVAASEPF